MSNPLLSLFLDFAVLAALGGTIYYVMRLSRALENFRKHRDELKGLIVELTSNIDHAQSAIVGLREAGNSAANDLDDVLHESRRMAEELKIINDTSENLATRLERAATSGRKTSPDVEDDYEEYEEPASADVEPPSFFIKDIDFEAEDEALHEGDELTSQAEKELYTALKKNKRKSVG